MLHMRKHHEASDYAAHSKLNAHHNVVVMQPQKLAECVCILVRQTLVELAQLPPQRLQTLSQFLAQLKERLPPATAHLHQRCMQHCQQVLWH